MQGGRGMQKKMKNKIQINTLKLWDKNPRSIDKKGFERLMSQLKRVKEITGEYLYKPLLITPDNLVIGGNMRLRALKELGETQAWVNVVNVRNEQEMLEVALSDNDQAGKTEKDLLLELIEQYPEIKLTDYAVSFDTPTTLEDFMSQFKEVEEDEVPEVPTEAISKLGEVYQLGRHRLMCGDATKIEDVEKLMNGQKADMVFTDPPYGIDADKMTMGTGKKDFHRGNWDSTRPDVLFLLGLAPKVCIWGGNYFADVLPVTNDWLCWHKKNDGLSFSEFELAWTNFGRNSRLISHHWGSEKKEHVTMKPVSVMAWGIEQIDTAKNILDPFLGSGSTLIACEQTNRTCYGMELDPKYCDVIRKRYENFTKDR